MTSDADRDFLSAAWCSADADAIPVNSGALSAAGDASASELAVFPVELLLSADNGELQDALLRLQTGSSDDTDGKQDRHAQSAAARAADDDVDGDALLRVLEVDASDALAHFSVATSSIVGESVASPASGGGSSSSNSSSAESSDQSKDSNPTRRRVKQELDYLRERVRGLQATLSALQQTQPENAALTVKKPSAWEGIAARQRDLRRKAQLENAKLRESLKAQLQLATSLERLLHKRPSLWTDDALSSKRFCGATGARVSGILADDPVSHDALVFESLIAKIDRSYASYRETLTQNGLLSAPCGHRATNVQPATCDGGGESMCVELLDVKAMPFGASATSSAAWRCITSGYMQLQHEVYRGFEGVSDTLAIKYAVTMTRKRLSVDVTARAVMKRFIEKEEGGGSQRVVFVWESISDTDGSSLHRRNPGIQVQERGWTVFSAATQDDRSEVSDDPQESSTQILTCMRMTPLVSSSANEDADVEDEGRQVGLLTNLSLDYFGEQLDQAHQAIECLLLDERTQ